MSEFPIYKGQVLADYDRKLALQQLSSKLIHVTPGNLKKESVRVCEERFLTKDKNFLRPIFGQKEDAPGYRNAIQNGNANPFRPLVNFLRDRMINTDEDNIELLAWLINFEPRPYMTWLKDPNRYTNEEIPEKSDYKLEKEVIIELEEKTGEDQPDHDNMEIVDSGVIKKQTDEIPPSPKPVAPVLNRKTIIVFVVVALIFSGGIYLMGRGDGGTSIAKTDSLRIAALQKKPTYCMVWKEDHYEPAPCDQASSGSLIIPLDTERLAHLKKMINTSSIKMSDVGHVWYFKSHGQLECFTAGGAYPLDTNRRLLPITPYMIHKYIHPEESNVIMNR